MAPTLSVRQELALARQARAMYALQPLAVMSEQTKHCAVLLLGKKDKALGFSTHILHTDKKKRHISFAVRPFFRNFATH